MNKWIPPNMSDANEAAIDHLEKKGMDPLDAGEYVSLLHYQSVARLSSAQESKLQELRSMYKDIFADTNS